MYGPIANRSQAEVLAGRNQALLCFLVSGVLALLGGAGVLGAGRDFGPRHDATEYRQPSAAYGRGLKLTAPASPGGGRKLFVQIAPALRYNGSVQIDTYSN